ncbi:MAG: transcriptional regulator NrdR [Candidatus Margulisiibacteriota bacterium]|nr:MAG: transcriptional regulator NrdR [Candidatus Margulisbacteria bacterium GWD2_39_127]OGI05346.1 MAG: transcriptional regulator NrdR [Candidatus Margulisbacteria bacterium GWF2_38_17]OGI05803.1 MAG: transcriptional regulator NrdR [Candidatus Margulisbacteria bacterium GWE2_39_32]PZM77399.1 MAG: transcriptional regulator NrdR [Candidatus Margulisiibacteriota bacterium]HAR62293.1 transcriptional regulator NrdR [Candidatus Margulisiibacteriota bacterium]
MRCPFCSYEEIKVIESRDTNDGKAIRRRRECLQCKNRFTSYERIEEHQLMVIKKDKRREPFDREKILSGLIKASEKRPVSIETIETTINDIEKKLRDDMIKEVPTAQIGEMIMDRLHSIDQIAYVRFASVYRQFKDVQEFIKEIKEVLS